MRYSRIPAHALLSVVVLSFIVSLMLSAMVLLAYSRSTEAIVYRSYIKAYRNIHSASEYVLAGNKLPPGQSAIDLFDTGEDSVYFRSMHWGLWEAAGFAAPVMRNTRVQKDMIYGCQLAGEFKSAVWAPSISYGLGLTGSALIKGNCYIAQGGIRTDVTVNGFASTLTKHFDGTAIPCSVTFMVQSQERITYLSNLIKGNWKAVYAEYEEAAGFSTDSTYRSFTQPTLCIRINNGMELSGKSVRGNCILYASNTVFIPANAKLDQVQIIAPVVIIESGFSGSVHVLASDSILMRSDVKLLYPSSLALSIETVKPKGTNITLEQGASVSGIIYSFQSVSDAKHTMIRIGEGASTQGIIYSNGYVELIGKHIGNITTTAFQYTTREQTITNVLPMGTIDYTALSSHFVIPLLTDKKSSLQTACWIQE